jgi:DegV family protein with EDD domain
MPGTPGPKTMQPVPTHAQKVAIVADSSISLPRALLEERGIQVAPLEVRFGEHTYLDGLDLAPTTFYEMLRTADPLPTTSAPQPASFLDAIRRAGELAPNVICLTLASRFSAAYESARAAAQLAHQELPGLSVRVVDTNTAAGAEALVALSGADAARRGETPEQAFEVCTQVMERVHLVAFMDTLHFLWKGGHIPRVAAWMGDALSVKPMLELTQDSVRLVARPRTRPRALDRLFKLVDRCTQRRPMVLNVVHAADPDGAHTLHQQLTDRFACAEAIVTEFSPAIGVHTGPGLLGAAFYVVE